jgi:hypothetical protein
MHVHIDTLVVSKIWQPATLEVSQTSKPLSEQEPQTEAERDGPGKAKYSTGLQAAH